MVVIRGSKIKFETKLVRMSQCFINKLNVKLYLTSHKGKILYYPDIHMEKGFWISDNNKNSSLRRARI